MAGHRARAAATGACTRIQRGRNLTAVQYLYDKELIEDRGLVEAMRDELHRLGHHDAALRTAAVLLLFQRIEAMQEELRGVWKAVEWACSSDILEEHVTAYVEEWRKVGRPPPPERVDIARRLYDLEQEAARLRREMGGSLDEGGE